MPQMTPAPLDPNARVFVAGYRGLAGSAVARALKARGFTDVVGPSSSELDLRDRGAVDAFFDETRPAVVIDAAARVGGILANSTYPAEFLSDNLRIQVNILDAAARTGVERFLFLGSTCIYPRLAPQPITEDALLPGPLEETNDALASALLFLLEHYDGPDAINVGIGEDVTIRELAEIVADVVGYDGEITWDTSKPDGTPRKLLSVDRLTQLGWKASIPLREGIASTYRWYVENEDRVR